MLHRPFKPRIYYNAHHILTPQRRAFGPPTTSHSAKQQCIAVPNLPTSAGIDYRNSITTHTTLLTPSSLPSPFYLGLVLHIPQHVYIIIGISTTNLGLQIRMGNADVFGNLLPPYLADSKHCCFLNFPVPRNDTTSGCHNNLGHQPLRKCRSIRKLAPNILRGSKASTNTTLSRSAKRHNIGVRAIISAVGF